MTLLHSFFVICHLQGTVWSPSKIISRLGKEIDNEESVCYWAYKVREGREDEEYISMCVDYLYTSVYVFCYHF